MTEDSRYHEVSALAVQRFEEAIGWRAGLPCATTNLPIAFLSHVVRAAVDVTEDRRPEPLMPELGAKGVNGGGSVHPLQAVRIGERLERVTEVEDRYTKAGADGPLDFVVVKNSFATPGGSVVAFSRMWMIYR
jgi:hypothetical protein